MSGAAGANGAGVKKSAKGSKGRVFLGMSGGVDSAMSAYLLQQEGYEVVGVYMKNWSRDLPGMKCPWAEDLADAKRVAVRLGLDFQVWDFEAEYKQRVVDYMLAEYAKGNTPNPDVMCNQEIKFGLFAELALKEGADFIATGHYAQIGETNKDSSENGAGVGASSRATAMSSSQLSSQFAKSLQSSSLVSLIRAKDENKDQTYFLYRVPQEMLGRTLFPVGGMLKSEVKALAAELGLPVAGKAESMGVCFVGEAGMREFLAEYVEVKPGEIVDVASGEVVGMHDGAIFYTLGQRHGLGLTDGLPYYVVRKDMERNVVYVSRDLNSAELWRDEVQLRDVVLRDCDTAGEIEVMVRVRHRAALVPGRFTVADGVLRFDEAQKALTPGQSVVFYVGDVCIGGGIIEI